MTTYDRINELCKERGISITALEEELGFGRGSIGKLKKGTTMSSARLQKIADKLGTTSDYLLNGTVQTSEHLSAYYEDQRAYELAKKIFENQRLRMLFDAAEDVDPEDLELVINMVKRFKRTNDSDE